MAKGERSTSEFQIIFRRIEIFAKKNLPKIEISSREKIIWKKNFAEKAKKMFVNKWKFWPNRTFDNKKNKIIVKKKTKFW